MVIKKLQENRIIREKIYEIGYHRAQKLLSPILNLLPKNSRIIDIGAGTCIISEILIRNGHHVTPLDIKNLSFTQGLQPLIYNGKKIPFDDNSFDFAFLFTVLHHLSDQMSLLKEAIRVSNRIVIVEDIYTSTLHKYMTFFFDSLMNLEFTGHPHSNRTDDEWRVLLTRLGLQLEYTYYQSSFYIFKIAYYLLKKDNPENIL